jgi:ribosomal protein L40E
MKEIRRSQYVTELQELESILKESGIDAKIVEYNGDLFNSTGSAVMFSLYVEDDDAERAAAIAAKCNPDNSKGVTYCRECGSENITKEVVRKRLPVYFLAIGLVVCAAGFFLPGRVLSWFCWIAGAVLVANTFVPFKRTLYYCNDCKKYFKDI